MNTLEEIKQMSDQGKTEDEIRQALKERGLSNQEIDSIISQTQIKDAVNQNPYQDNEKGEEIKMPEEEDGMQPSILSQTAPATAEVDSTQEQVAAPGPGQQYQPYTQDVQSYQPQQQYSSSGVSPDTITEIAEQVIAEKTGAMQTEIEKIKDMRNTVESKITYLDERLRRIEKIIDRLELSILQKVGDYMTNVQDLKKEIIETQKSFKSMADKVPPHLSHTVRSPHNSKELP